MWALESIMQEQTGHELEGRHPKDIDRLPQVLGNFSPLLTLIASRLLTKLYFYFGNSIFYCPFNNLYIAHFVMLAAYTISCLVSYLTWKLLEGGCHYLPILSPLCLWWWLSTVSTDSEMDEDTIVVGVRSTFRVDLLTSLAFSRETCVFAMES